MSQISDIKNPWRNIILSQPASFRSIVFHVDAGNRASGRRTALHEYPKRNDPYAEDMGRQARRFSFTAYLIYRPVARIYDYVTNRKALYEALEQDDAGMLIHPVFAPGGMMVMCEHFSMSETRERGGYTSYDIQFVEAGNSVSTGSGISLNTRSDVQSRAADVLSSALGILGNLPIN